MIGTLIWGRGDRLRFSLDRADLWDLRPVKEFAGEKFRFRWIEEQVLKGDYAPVQQMSDVPYERDPAPTKIPAGALDFALPANGKVESVRLFLRQAAVRGEMDEWRPAADVCPGDRPGRLVPL